MRARQVLAAGAVTGILAGVTHGVRTWYRFGRPSRSGAANDRLDTFMPECDVLEQHQARVAAPAATTFEMVRALNPGTSRLITGIFRARELMLRSTPTTHRAPLPFLEEMLALGWRVLAEEAGREIVLGAVTQPWRADVVFRGLPPGEFRDFDEPGHVKIVVSFKVEPHGEFESVFRTETRAKATDPEAYRRFRRYWLLVSPGIRLIRVEMLRLIRREAEALAAARRTTFPSGAEARIPPART